jgi:uncharacterized protein (DUF58 family)
MAAPLATLDPRVLSAIADLELVARVTVDGTIAGLHRSPFHGYSAEFSQYRPYRAGDDLKYVDWKLYARTDRFYTKQFRETTNLFSLLALDASASMGFAGAGGVTKFGYARLLAAALSHLLTAQGDGIGLVIYDQAVRQFIPSRTGRSHVRSLLVAVSRVEPGGGTAAATALRRASELLKRRGLLLVFSDLYDDEEAVDRELRRAVRMGHEVAVFHVLTPEELTLGLDGEVEVEDLESRQTVLTRASAARPAYRARFDEFLERWRTRCTSHGIDYTQALTDAPLDETLRGFLIRRGVAGPAR